MKAYTKLLLTLSMLVPVAGCGTATARVIALGPGGDPAPGVHIQCPLTSDDGKPFGESVTDEHGYAEVECMTKSGFTYLQFTSEGAAIRLPLNVESQGTQIVYVIGKGFSIFGNTKERRNFWIKSSELKKD